MYLGPCGGFTSHKWILFVSDNHVKLEGDLLGPRPQHRGLGFLPVPLFLPDFLAAAWPRWIEVVDFDSAF